MSFLRIDSGPIGNAAENITCNTRKSDQQKTRRKHTVAIKEACFDVCCQLKKTKRGTSYVSLEREIEFGSSVKYACT